MSEIVLPSNTRLQHAIELHDITCSVVTISRDSTKKLVDNNNCRESTLNNGRWVDRSMLLPKLCYLCHFAKESYVTYMLLFLTSIGLDAAQAGLVTSVRLFGLITGNFVWGIISDSKQAHRTILYILSIFGALFFVSQPFISAQFGTKANNRCPRLTFNATKNNSMETLALHQGRFTTKELMNFLMIVSFMAAFFDGAIPSFIDAAVMKKICRYKISFGRQRLFGSVGFCFGSIIQAILLDTLSLENMNCYAMIFVTYLVFLVLTLICTQLLYKEINLAQAESSMTVDSNRNIETNFASEFFKAVFTVDMLVLFFTSFNFGLFCAVGGFTMLYLKTMHAPYMLIGLLMVSAGVSGVTIYASSGWMTKKLGGVWNTIIFATCGWSARFFSMRFINSPWQVPLVDLLLHGVSVPLYNVTSARQIKLSANERVFTAMFSVNNALLYGVGVSVGNIIIGYLYKNYGVDVMYTSLSCASLSWAAVLLAFRGVSYFRRQRQNHEL